MKTRIIFIGILMSALSIMSCNKDSSLTTNEDSSSKIVDTERRPDFNEESEVLYSSSSTCTFKVKPTSFTSNDPNCTNPGPAYIQFESASTGTKYTYTVGASGRTITLPLNDTYYIWIYAVLGSGNCISATVTFQFTGPTGLPICYTDSVLLDYDRPIIKVTGGMYQMTFGSTCVCPDFDEYPY